MKTVVNVTQRHIERGTPGDCHCCPIAFGIRDTFDLHFYPRVFDSAGTACVSFDPMDKIKGGTYELPDACIRFLSDFDTGKKVEPFSFELEVP